MKPTLMSITAEYLQDADGSDPTGDTQTLTLEMTQCGGGPYLVITTERWAIDRPQELNGLLQHFAQVKTLFNQEPDA